MIEGVDEYVIAHLDEETRDEANEAVRRALEKFSTQPWYVTAYARIRFSLYWSSFKIRMHIAHCLVFRMNFDAVKTFNRLGL